MQAQLDSYGEYMSLLMFQRPLVGVCLASMHSLLLRLGKVLVCLVVHVPCNVFDACAASRGNCSPKKIALNFKMNIPSKTRTGPCSTCIARCSAVSQCRTVALGHEDKV